MRTLLPLLILTTLTSCQKEYTCVCNSGWVTTKTEEVTVKATSKDNAKNKCIDKSGGLAGAISGKSCHLKE